MAPGQFVANANGVYKPVVATDIALGRFFGGCFLKTDAISRQTLQDGLNTFFTQRSPAEIGHAVFFARVNGHAVRQFVKAQAHCAVFAGVVSSQPRMVGPNVSHSL